MSRLEAIKAAAQRAQTPTQEQRKAYGEERKKATDRMRQYRAEQRALEKALEGMAQTQDLDELRSMLGAARSK